MNQSQNNKEQFEEIIQRYHHDFSDFDEFASEEEKLIVMHYITQEANRAQRRLVGLEQSFKCVNPGPATLLMNNAINQPGQKKGTEF